MTEERNELVVASVACGSESEARQLARGLVEGRLAACVQLHPIRSIYRWQGGMEEEGEVMLTAKTTRSALPALERYVCTHHSYDVPEIVAVGAIWAHDPYVAWVEENVLAQD